MNETLTCVRRLMTGVEIDFCGRFFKLEHTAIRPAPGPATQLIRTTAAQVGRAAWPWPQSPRSGSC